MQHARERSAYRILVRKPEGRRPLRKLEPKWENNIKMNFKATRRESVDWINMRVGTDGGALVKTEMNVRVP
jgi:hypothetical protein